jgi:hypothetical protein
VNNLAACSNYAKSNPIPYVIFTLGEDFMRIKHLVIVAELACFAMLASITSSGDKPAKWFWMMPPGLPPFNVNPDPHAPIETWNIEKVYTEHEKCKSDVKLSNAMAEHQNGPSDNGIKDNYCISTQDHRWKGHTPNFLLLDNSGGNADIHEWTIKASFIKMDACLEALKREKASGLSDEAIECVGLDDVRWLPAAPKVQWLLLIPPAFGGENAALKDWSVSSTHDDEDACVAAKQIMPGALCVKSDDPRLR